MGIWSRHNICLQGSSFSLNPWCCEIATPLIHAFPAFQCVLTSRFNVTYLICSQAGKQAIDLIVDFLHALWEYAKEQITSVVDLSVCPTVKVGRRSHQCICDRLCGCMAYCTCCMGREGLQYHALSGNHRWLGTSSHGGRHQLEGPPAHNYVCYFLPNLFVYLTKSVVIRELEAAAVHSAPLTSPDYLTPGQDFMVCDAGGGIVVRTFVTMVPRLSYNCSPGFGYLQNFGSAKPQDLRGGCTVRGQLWIYIPVRVDAITTVTKTNNPASGIYGSSN